MVGWGEGLDEAARYLNAKGGPDDLEVASWYSAGSFSYFFDGRNVDGLEFDRMPAIDRWLDTDYFVLYVHQWQRQLPELRFLNYMRHFAPEHEIVINDIPYVQVYAGEDVPPPPYLSSGRAPRFVDWDGSIRLLGYMLPEEPLAPGETLQADFLLENIAPIERNLNVLVRVMDAAGNELLRDEGWPWGSATSGWPLNEIWRDGHTFSVPEDAKPGVYRVELSFYDPSSLDPLPAVDAQTGELLPPVHVVDLLVVQDAGARPSPVVPLATFGDRYQLDSALMPTGAATSPGHAIAVTLDWSALQAPQTLTTTDFSSFVHLVGPDGELIAQSDIAPANTFVPPRLWQPGISAPQTYALTIPEDAAPGIYQLWAGLYNEEGRLPVTTEENETRDAVLIGEIGVQCSAAGVPVLQEKIEQRPRRHRALYVLGAILFLGGMLVLLFGLNMRRGLNHDEHQFVASAELIAQLGMLPYRDFPYFHVPALSFIYAALFQLTDYHLMVARWFSIVSSWLMLSLLFGTALVWLGNLKAGVRFVVAASIVMLLMTSPSFLHASGRAWNHDFPVLLTVLAACIMAYWLTQRIRPIWWMIIPGLLIGLATGVRLSFVLVAAPFVLMILLAWSWRSRQAWYGILLFGVGMAIGFLPSLVMFALAPQEFLFGNLTYARLNTVYYSALADPAFAMSLGQKVVRTVEYILTEPGNLLLVAPVIMAIWRVHRQIRMSVAPEIVFLLLLLLSLLVAAFAPTPIQRQYIYPLFPVFALLLIAALARDDRPRPLISVLVVVTVISIVLSVPRYVEGAQVAFTPDEWFPLKVHAQGERLAELAGGGQVLTLAPIYPLEGGASIYPALVTGPMGWRVAPLLSGAQRQAQGLLGLDDLPAALAAEPPRAIYTGLHDNDTESEAPFLAYAQEHGYVPIAMPDDATLWVAPVAAWDDLIRLGAVELPHRPVQPGEAVVATFYLQSAGPLEQNLNVLVRVVDPAGNELVRSEGWPWGRPTSTWPLDEVWPDGHVLQIPPDAPSGPYRIEMDFYTPGTLDHLGETAVVGYLYVGQESEPVDELARFADGIQLLTAEVPADGWTAGTEQRLRLHWAADAAYRGRYTVFAHLLGPDGTLTAQGDQEPLGGFYPTDAWLPHLPVEDEYTLSLPTTINPGAYRLVVGLYDPSTGARLPLLDQGHPNGDALEIGRIEIP